MHEVGRFTLGLPGVPSSRTCVSRTQIHWIQHHLAQTFLRRPKR